uniref:hypothetical protein n=1 Tax=Herbidospora sakaeratensis TaxID=564415 RepID=UPI000A516C2B|nr:hypothetical protein [Herbidospora sakaeratensis]
MTASAQDPSILEMAHSLSPAAVSQFLATESWRLESRVDHVREVWSLPADDGRLRGRLLLPLDSSYLDFADRLYDALVTIGKVNNWDPEVLQEHIIATRADLFFVRLDQAMTDGTIPFRQAELTIEGIWKLLRAAATTAANPDHSHQGRRPAAVTDFLEDDVRLGHTKRGSFVFTVVSRIGDSEPSFQRRVMETLARGLETTKNITEGRDLGAFDEPSRWGLSAGLVEAIEDMAEPEALRAIDLSFEWAAALERPPVGDAPITLERHVIPQLGRVRERLIRQEEPKRRVTLIGTVKSLTREGGRDENESGAVILHAEVNGRYRNVHMILDGPDHDWAIIAYRSRVPFTVSGDLVFERRAWRLQGDIAVDSSFLRTLPMARDEN